MSGTRCLWAVPLLAVLFLAGPGTDDLAAQEGGVVFGVHGMWDSEADFGIGGRVLGNIEAIDLEAIGEFDLFFPEGGDLWELNGLLFYHFHLPDTRSVLPYVGGGLSIARFSNGFDETELGLNLGGGVRFPNASAVTPYLEGRAVVSDFEDRLVLTGGVLFGRAGFR